MMERVLDQLPKAARWSLIVAVCFILFIFFYLIGFLAVSAKQGGVSIIAALLPFGLLVLQCWFFFAYRGACKRALRSGEAEDVEQACRWQKRLIVLYGVFSLLALLMIAFGFLAAMVGR